MTAERKPGECVLIDSRGMFLGWNFRSWEIDYGAAATFTWRNAIRHARDLVLRGNHGYILVIRDWGLDGAKKWIVDPRGLTDAAFEALACIDCGGLLTADEIDNRGLWCDTCAGMTSLASRIAHASL